MKFVERPRRPTRPSDRGHRHRAAHPTWLIGTKNGSPCTWSQCRWVTSARPWKEPSAGSVSPQNRKPVPRSSTIGSMPGASIATHAVLPPYRRLSSHGHGVEPRTPQNVMFSNAPSPGFPSLSLTLPNRTNGRQTCDQVHNATDPRSTPAGSVGRHRFRRWRSGRSPPTTSRSPTSRPARARSRSASTASPTRPGGGVTCSPSWRTPGSGRWRRSCGATRRPRCRPTVATRPACWPSTPASSTRRSAATATR